MRFLEGKELVTVKDIPNEDDSGFANRLRIQKCVYLADRFGLDLGYEHGIYRHGPHSPRLAGDYYDLAEHPEAVATAARLPETFDQGRFLAAVGNKDEAWLELASTLIDQGPGFDNDGDPIGHVEPTKCDYTIAQISNVLADLHANNLA